jgi:hypothetical protein
VCALDVLAGVWLWKGRARGARLGLATDVPALVLGVGFALPFLLAGVPIRAALVIAGRKVPRMNGPRPTNAEMAQLVAILE